MAKNRAWPFTAEDIDRVTKAAIRQYALDVEKQLAKPTEAWQASVKPTFITTEVMEEGGNLVVKTGVNPGKDKGSLIYLWVTRGTKRHSITAVNAETLAYMDPYYASTSRRSWQSNTPSYGNNLKQPVTVMHPGIEPREFEELAVEEMGPGFAPKVQSAITLLVKGTASFAEAPAAPSSWNVKLASMAKKW